jgi:hypothetical protein
MRWRKLLDSDDKNALAARKNGRRRQRCRLAVLRKCTAYAS